MGSVTLRDAAEIRAVLADGKRQQRPTSAERWITVGAVLTGWFVVERGWGTPDGFLMAWRGRVSVFQPREFRQWEHVLWAVERRMQLARLEWVAIACTVPRHGLHVTLVVLVRRGKF